MIVSESKAGSRLLLAKVEEKTLYTVALCSCRLKNSLQIMVGFQTVSIQQELNFSDVLIL